jgi:TolB-like protein/DNA-binding winged helix-turn-helix (wHTH) protein/Flp pilus assembly protein TadD
MVFLEFIETPTALTLPSSKHDDSGTGRDYLGAEAHIRPDTAVQVRRICGEIRTKPGDGPSEAVMEAETSTFQFESFTLDLSRGCLRCDGGEIALRPKSFGVLRFLVANAGRLVSKDEILQAVWPDVFVTEDSLIRCIHEIRGALGDNAQRIVRTLPKRGYLFDVPVAPGEATLRSAVPHDRAAESGAQPLQAPAPIHRRMPWRLAVGVATVLGVLALGLLHLQPISPPPIKSTSIAVLPFAGSNGDPRTAQMADAISEDLITNLAKFPGIVVAARSATAPYSGKLVNAREVSQALAVRYVLIGSVRASEGQLRISAQLVEATTEEQLWAERFDGSLSQSVTGHDDVVREIAANLASAVRKAAVQRIAHRPVDELSALELVLRAHDLSANNPDYKSALEARTLLRKASEADPTLATAYDLLGREYYRGFVLQWDGPEALDQAYSLVQRAIALDSTSASAFDLLGRVYLRQRKHDLAIATLEKTIGLNPNRAESYATLADTLTFAGRAAEAIGHMRTAMRLSPQHPPHFDMYLGRALYFAGRYEQAFLSLDICAARAPQYRPCYMYLAPVYAELGRMDDARRTVEKLQAVSPGFSIDASVRQHLPYVAAAMDYYIGGLRKAGVPE